MKRWVVILLLAVCCAGYGRDTVMLYLKDGTSVGYSFDEKPVLTYSGNELVVSTRQVRVQYPLESLDRLSFEDHSHTAVEEAVKPDVSFHVGEEALTVAGEKPETEIGVYTLNGMRVASTVVDENGEARLSLGDLSDGIYVVRSCSLSFKIVR